MATPSTPYRTATEKAADNLQDKVQFLGKEIKDKAEAAADTLSKEGKRAAVAVEKGAEDAYAATKRFVQEQPLLAVAGVATFAFALGALWKLSPGRSRYGNEYLDRAAAYLEPHYRSLRSRW